MRTLIYSSQHTTAAASAAAAAADAVSCGLVCTQQTSIARLQMYHLSYELSKQFFERSFEFYVKFILVQIYVDIKNCRLQNLNVAYVVVNSLSFEVLRSVGFSCC